MEANGGGGADWSSTMAAHIYHNRNEMLLRLQRAAKRLCQLTPHHPPTLTLVEALDDSFAASVDGACGQRRLQANIRHLRQGEWCR